MRVYSYKTEVRNNKIFEWNSRLNGLIFQGVLMLSAFLNITIRTSQKVVYKPNKKKEIYLYVKNLSAYKI